MRKSLSIAAALFIATTGAAFAHGGENSDRGDTNPLVTGQAQQVQVTTSSEAPQSASADVNGGYVESLR